MNLSTCKNLYKNIKTTECKLTDINKIIELDKLFKSKIPKDNIWKSFDSLKRTKQNRNIGKNNKLLFLLYINIYRAKN